MKKYSLILLLVSLQSFYLGAQFLTLEQEDGLPGNQISALHSDQSGQLWIGTLQGLAIFDGENIIPSENYLKEGAVQDKWIRKIESVDGQIIWILNRGNLQYFNAARRRLSPVIAKNVQNFFLTDQELIAVQEDARLIISTKKNGTFSPEVTVQDPNSPLTICSHEEITYYFLTDSLRRYAFSDSTSWSQPFNPIAKVKILSQDTLLVLSENRLFKVTLDKSRDDLKVSKLSGRQVIDFDIKDSQLIMLHPLMLSTGVLSGEKLHITKEINLPEATGAICHIDAFGQVWIGTQGQGLLKVDPDSPFKFRHVKKETGGAYSITSMKAFGGATFIGTSVGHLLQKSGEETPVVIERIYPGDQDNQRVISLQPASNNLFGATWNGDFFEIAKKESSKYSFNPIKPVQEAGVRDALYSPLSREYFIGTVKGLLIRDEEDRQVDILKEHIVTCLQLWGDSLWIGTQSGLYAMQTASRKLSATQMPGKHIYSLALLPDSTLAIGTFNEGLFIKRRGRSGVRPYQKEDYFEDKSISAIVAGHDRLWVAHSDGLTLATDSVLLDFGSSYGVRDLNFNWGAYGLINDSVAFMGTTNGYYQIFLNQRYPPNPPAILIVDSVVAHLSRGRHSVLNTKRETLELPAKTQSIDLYIRVLHSTAANQNTLIINDSQNDGSLYKAGGVRHQVSLKNLSSWQKLELKYAGFNSAMKTTHLVMNKATDYTYAILSLVILSVIVLYIIYRSSKSKGKYSPKELFKIQIDQLIEEHYSDPNFGLSEMSKQLGLSRTSLNNKVKTHLGTTPIDYLIQSRLEIAKQRLEQGDLSVKEIAHQCGFTDAGYFSKSFKKHFGVSPSEVRG